MTHISPRVASDTATHFERLARANARNAALDIARSLTLWLAYLGTAASVGYLLGAAQATCTALPQIVAQAQTMQGW